MNLKNKKINNWLWNIISSGLPLDYDLNILRKFILLNIIAILGTISLGILSIICFIQNNNIVAVFDIVLILFLLGLLYVLRIKKCFAFVGLVGTIVTGLFYLFLIANGGIERTAYLWILTYPIIVLYLLGKKLGSYFSIIFLFMACIFFLLGSHLYLFQSYDISIIIRVIAVYTTIFCIAFVTETVREKVQKNLVSEINDRKEIEKALRNSESFLDDVIESIQDGISVLDPDLTIRHTNSVMKQWYHKNLPFTGKKCHVCYHGKHYPCEPCPTVRCIESGNPEKEIVQGSAESPVEWLEVSSFPIRDKGTGDITGAVEFVRDITIPKRLENQLAQAQKMEAAGTLAGGVAHDLNNILSGLVSYPELLLMDLPAESPIRGPIETIHKSGKKAAAIVQDLLTLARRGVPINEVVNLNDTIRSFMESPECINIKKYHPNVSFGLDLQPDLLNIIGSSVHLSKTIMNLISNGAEAIIDGGVVTVGTKNIYIDNPIDGYEKIPEGEYVLLTIKDSGLGISAEDLNKIFEPFYTKKRMGRSGTGLGMAVVWGTVKDLHGFIDVKSKPGNGTTFFLYIPITRQKLPKKEHVVPIEKYMGNEKILIIDDVEEQRDIAASMLEKLGYTVSVVSSGEESLRFLSHNKADILILDMIMEPGMDGLETYNKVIQLYPKQRAIIASGYSETARVKEAQRLGVGKYIKKPYTLETLGLSVRAELNR